MEEKINDEQLSKLVSVMTNNKIPTEWVKGVCRVKLFVDITVKQYNYLLAIIERDTMKDE